MTCAHLNGALIESARQIRDNASANRGNQTCRIYALETAHGSDLLYEEESLEEEVVR